MIADMMNVEMQKLLDEAYDVHNENIEALSRNQFKEVIAQMVASGDIVRHVMNHPESAIHRQAITYIPYRDVMELKQRISVLEAELLHNPTEDKEIKL